LVHAGLDGIRRGMTLPPERPEFWAMTEDARAAAGIGVLPRSLGAALDLLEATEAVAEWFGEAFLAAYLIFKRGEIASLALGEPGEVCRRYAEVY